MKHHSIVHFDLVAKDRDALAQFYQQLFGWQYTHHEELKYTMLRTGGGLDGGIAGLSDQSSGQVFYISTDDIDAALRKVIEHGGTVAHPREDVPGVGELAYFRDPTGNTVGFWRGEG
ncbi:MAG: VOC family protein [Anaerolineae bacterium]|nr:VOC family protein [Anaerolineae bacterium]